MCVFVLKDDSSSSSGTEAAPNQIASTSSRSSAASSASTRMSTPTSTVHRKSSTSKKRVCSYFGYMTNVFTSATLVATQHCYFSCNILKICQLQHKCTTHTITVLKHTQTYKTTHTFTR